MGNAARKKKFGSMAIKRAEVIPFLVRQLKNQEFKNICANYGVHRKPNPINWEKGETGHVPDITAEKQDAIGVFSVVEEPEAISKEEIERLRLFSTFTAKQKGRHFLVTELEKAGTLLQFCKSHEINAKILPIERSTSG